MNGALIRDLRIYGRAFSNAGVSQLTKATRAAYLVAKPAAERSEAETAEVFGWWIATLDKPTQDLTGQLAALEREEKELKGRGTVAHVMQERTEPAIAFILFRGEYDKRRDQVSPGTPAALPPMPADLPRNRLGLAQWLLRPEHPLTTRVTVNRFWQELFGTGLVRTTGDLGVSGEMPTHPELLDWMAVEFRESGWDMKKFYRLLVTSAAYRQAATRDAGETGERRPEPAAFAWAALPHGRRSGSRLCPGVKRITGAQAGRAERPALSAAGRMGSRGHGGQHARSMFRTMARSCIAAACTRFGSAARRRRRWRF